MTYNKTDYEILHFLINGEFYTEFKSCTIKIMIRELKFSESKIRLAINNFIKDGYVKEGIKQGKSKTYFITDKGLEELRNLIN